MAHTFNYSIVPLENNNTPPDGMPENQPASTVNDAWRQGKSYERATWGDISGEDGVGNDLVSGGSANAYTLSIRQNFSAYNPGMNFTFQANHSNTGAATLAVTTPSLTLDAKPIVNSTGSALGADAIQSGQWVTVKYTASNDRFVLLSAPLGTATTSIQNSTLVYLTNVTGANAVSANANPTLTAYVEGQRFHFKVATDNTAAVTLDIDAVGPVNVKTVLGEDLPPGSWFANGIVEVIYDGGNFVFIGTVGLQTVEIPASAFSPTVINGCGFFESAATNTNQPDVKGLPFASGADSFAQLEFRLPSSWDKQPIFFEAQWAHLEGTGSFGVAWTFQALALDDNATYSTAYPAAVTVTDTGGIGKTKYRSPRSTAHTVGGTPADTTDIILRVGRDVSTAGNLNADALLTKVTVLYNVKQFADL